MVKPQAPHDRTVVLIEDDEFIAAALRDLLELNGYHVVVATTTRAVNAALAGAQGRGVVLLDPLVPGVSAATLMRSLNDGQALITIAVAVYPPGGRKPPPGKRHHGRRIISTDLLLEMVRESFGEGGNDPMAYASRRAA
jgi:PleD family two-component response regulator